MVTGNLALALALPAAVFSLVMSLLAARDERLLGRAVAGIHAVTALVTIASAAITLAFVTDSFGISYVNSYSSLALPLIYKLTGIWAGLEGSLLFWAWLVVICGSILAATRRGAGAAYAYAVLQAIAVFFLVMIVFDANPFTRIFPVPPDGKGLNPLLQNFFMLIHPPALYFGYVGFAVPFALVVAGLIAGDLKSNRERWADVRLWTLASWLLLTLGNLLGAMWAYVELGWGGFWAWDPVENAGILPWFTATAFLHTLIVQERMGMFRIWNAALVILTFLFTIFGTFITRSGIIRSVHSFSDMRIGMYFIVFLAVATALCAALLWMKRDEAKGEAKLETIVSREGAFYVNSVLFVLALAAILWGTMLPLFYELATGQKVEVGPPYFNRAMAPIGAAILILMGIGSEMSWRRWRKGLFMREFLWPTIFAAAVTAVCAALGIRTAFPLAVAAGAAFVTATIAAEFVRSAPVAARREGVGIARGICSLFRRAPRRYGGYVVHIGVVLLLIGVAGSAYKSAERFRMAKGGHEEIAGFELSLDSVDWVRGRDSEGVVANVALKRGGEELTRLTPALFLHRNQPKPIAEVDLYVRPLKDVYLALGGVANGGEVADFELTINPLISFVWLGGAVMVLGTVLALIPARKRGAGREALPLEEELDIALGRAGEGGA